MKKLLLLFFALSCLLQISLAQTARVYRAGALIGTYSTLADASAVANTLGDSILLSAHTFKEHYIPMHGGQTWQGTMTATDTSTIDAEKLNVIGVDFSISARGRALNIRDIICTNGHNSSTISGGTGGGAFYIFRDTLALRGHTIVRNCSSKLSAGGVYFAYIFDHVKITNNHSDSCGGGGGIIYAFDSSEICYNTAKFGGAIGRALPEGGALGAYSTGVRIHHNTATLGGGAVYGQCGIYNGQIIDNKAPVGAALYSTTGAQISGIYNAKIYNPDGSGNRQNEICLTKASILLGGVWFGKSDTIGLTKIIKLPPFPDATITGKYAIANWSVNWGKPISKADTLFPIGAGFTYNDGTPLPLNSLPWLTGNFSSSTGKIFTPNPKMSQQIR